MIFKLFSYIQYLLKSVTRHSVHSPFVYKLVDVVIRDKQERYAFRQISNVRKKLLQSSQLIETSDFKKRKNSSQISYKLQSIGDITRKSSVNEKYGRLIFRLVEYFNPQVSIELGTSVGISTLYISLAKPGNKIYTIEGCSAKAEQALKCFDSLQCTNIMQYTGEFEYVLPEVIQQAGKPDFVYIDGDHTYNATIANFETLLKSAHNNTVFIFDDIHWSSGMTQAWKQITDHEQVTVSIDLFRIGIVLLKKELSKQKFVIRF